ncbi:MAG: LuxR C-terminal-related transcriptional regulator [Prevotellaceae bacterium]|jgi:regulator of cell morphogenesis and NO signaling|nr:LuxR C-terminal-related transcriptional regulator [Prevotellaceae bacterium]
MYLVITHEDKLADVLQRDSRLIAVAESLGVELGFGDKSVREVCAERKVDVDFFIALLNVVSTERYYPAQPLQALSALQLVAYLRSVHRRYRSVQLGVIQGQVERLAASGAAGKRLQLVEQTFGEASRELLRYFSDVDEMLFARVQRLYASCVLQASGQASPDEPATPVNFPALQQRYRLVCAKLHDVNNLLIKYLTGDFDRALRNAVIYQISDMEADLRCCLRLQELLLLPAMIQLRCTLTNKRLEDVFRYNSQTIDLADGKELSEREREVLRSVAQGLSSNVIAKRLGISVHTVQAHRKNITAKLGVKSVPALTTYAIMHGVVTSES